MPTDIIATQKQRVAKLQEKKSKAIATATQQQEEDDKDGGSKKKMVKLHVEQMVHGRLVKTWTQDKAMDEAALNPAPVRTEVIGADNASKVSLWIQIPESIPTERLLAMGSSQHCSNCLAAALL